MKSKYVHRESRFVDRRDDRKDFRVGIGQGRVRIKQLSPDKWEMSWMEPGRKNYNPLVHSEQDRIKIASKQRCMTGPTEQALRQQGKRFGARFYWRNNDTGVRTLRPI